MAASASVTATASVAGGIIGTKTLSVPTLSNPTSTDAVDVKALSSGFNSVSVPTNAVGVFIVPPVGNAQAITLKGVTGDTGVALHLTNWTMLSLGAAQTTIGITLGGAITVEFWWW